jgi:hypothetical protein
MNPWNRLFVVIAICWAIVSPLLIAAEANRGPAQALHDCSDSAYQQYGSSDSARFDMYRYIAEKDACNHAYARDGVHLPRVLSAMFGGGDRILGVAGWGFLLIPLVLLWILSWGIGRFVIWIVAGFYRLVRRRKRGHSALGSRRTREAGRPTPRPASAAGRN